MPIRYSAIETSKLTDSNFVQLNQYGKLDFLIIPTGTESNTVAVGDHTHEEINTATNANTANTIIKRDESGNFSAGTITANLFGNASTATKLKTSRNISLTGDITGSANFDGSANISLSVALSNSGVTSGIYNNSSTSITPFTVDSKGRIVSTSSPVTITPSWANIQNKPTTIAGYGITDSFTKTEVNNLITAATNLTQISTDLIPTSNSLLSIGSTTNRWKAIYVDEAHLSTNTLYLGDTPVMGTDQDTIRIHGDPGQSLNIATTGSGSVIIESEKGISLQTSQMNADVIVQASGSGSKMRFGANSSVEFVGPEIINTGNLSITGDLTVTGNATFNGVNTIVNSTTITVEDNIVIFNSGEVGHGVTAGTSGIRIDRGEEADYQILFDESDDLFKVGMIGDMEIIASRPWVEANFSNVRKYIKVLGNSTAKEFTINHGLNTLDVVLSTYSNSAPFNMVYPDYEIIDSNSIKVKFDIVPSNSQYKTVIIG